MVQNKGLIFKSVPTDWPIEGKDLVIEDREFDLNTEPPKDGITTKNYYVSFDPFQRGRMRAPEVKSYSPPFELGKPITNSAVSRVLKSNNSRFKEGDVVTGLFPTEEYSVISGEIANGMIRTLDNEYHLDPKLFIGVLGMPGLTAYSSFYAIGAPKKGETIFISAASGAVGQTVGQLAKHEGLIVIGSVGNDDKLEFIKKDLKFDEGFNYKKEKASEALRRLAPKGIDIYYENVGGEQLDAALGAMNNFGRISAEAKTGVVRQNANTFIVACGMVSQYNISDPGKRYGVKNMGMIVGKRIKMQGFIVFDPDMGPKHAVEHQKNVSRWISEGTFKAQQSVTEGIDNSVKGLLGMLKGENFGKAVLTIEELKVNLVAKSFHGYEKLTDLVKKICASRIVFEYEGLADR
ncbi:hypothetical protein MMC28_010376 [Mycoblastus sanguinarius]|nr:hypothetical protein [Mycoblastus sanguinarius]